MIFMKIIYPNIFILFILMFIVSCTPNKLILNRNDIDSYFISVNLLNGIDKARKINDNSLLINKDAVISLKIDDVTQYQMEFDLSLLEGNQIAMFLNSTNYDYNEKPYVAIELSDNGYKIKIGTAVIAQSNSIRFMQNENHRIKFTLDAGKLFLKLDCTDMTIDIPNQISTEYIFFRTNAVTSGLIKGIKLVNLREGMNSSLRSK